jgi:hypothetical protein
VEGGDEGEFICFNDTTEGPRALGSAFVALLVSNLCDVISDYVGFESDPASTVKSVWASVLSMCLLCLCYLWVSDPILPRAILGPRQGSSCP